MQEKLEKIYCEIVVLQKNPLKTTMRNVWPNCETSHIFKSHAVSAKLHC